MTGKDLIKWIKDHKAEEMIVTIRDDYRFDNGGWYLDVNEIYTVYGRDGQGLFMGNYAKYLPEDTEHPHNYIVL